MFVLTARRWTRRRSTAGEQRDGRSSGDWHRAADREEYYDSQRLAEFDLKNSTEIPNVGAYSTPSACNELLRAAKTGGTVHGARTPLAKLFEVAKITQLKDTGLRFAHALPTHYPNDSAMIEVFATLPKTKSIK